MPLDHKFCFLGSSGGPHGTKQAGLWAVLRLHVFYREFQAEDLAMSCLPLDKVVPNVTFKIDQEQGRSRCSALFTLFTSILTPGVPKERPSRPAATLFEPDC